MIKKNFGMACLLAALLCTSASAAFARGDGEHDQWQHKNEWHHDGGQNPQWSPLSDDKKELLRGAMESAHAKNEKLGKQMYALHLDMSKALQADKFDKARFMADYDKIAALHAKAERNNASAFAAVAGKLTPEERQHAAMMAASARPGMGRGGMERGHMMHHEGWKHDGKHGQPGCDMAKHDIHCDPRHGGPHALENMQHQGPMGNDYGHLND